MGPAETISEDFCVALYCFWVAFVLINLRYIDTAFCLQQRTKSMHFSSSHPMISRVCGHLRLFAVGPGLIQTLAVYYRCACSSIRHLVYWLGVGRVLAADNEWCSCICHELTNSRSDKKFLLQTRRPRKKALPVAYIRASNFMSSRMIYARRLANTTARINN